MKDLLTVPITENHTLTRRKSAGLRQVLSANLKKRLRQGLEYTLDLSPLFLGLLNPYKKVLASIFYVGLFLLDFLIIIIYLRLSALERTNLLLPYCLSVGQVVCLSVTNRIHLITLKRFNPFSNMTLTFFPLSV